MLGLKHQWQHNKNYKKNDTHYSYNFFTLLNMSTPNVLPQEDLSEVQGTYTECRQCGKKTQYVAKLNKDVEYSRAYCTSCGDPGRYIELYNKSNES